MTENGYTPSASDLKLVAALLEHASIEEAARVAGVSRATAFRRLNDEGFLGVLREARMKAFSSFLASLSASASEAPTVARALMNDPCAPAAVRLRAALGLMDRVLKAFEEERRVRELEEAIPRIEALERERQAGRGRYGYR